MNTIDNSTDKTRGLLIDGLKTLDLKKINEALDKGVDVEIYVNMGDPLIKANSFVRKIKLRVLQWVLRLMIFADKKVFNKTLFDRMLSKVKDVRKESQYKDEDGTNLLGWAIQTVEPDLVEDLIQRGAYMPELEPVIDIIENSHLKSTKNIILILDLLFNSGISANSKGDDGKPLLLMVLEAGGPAKIVEIMIKNGAKLEEKDNKGISALEYISSGKLKEKSIGYHDSIVRFIKKGKLEKKTIKKLIPKTDVLDYITDEELKQVFGFDEEGCTKLRSLLKNMDKQLSSNDVKYVEENGLRDEFLAFTSSLLANNRKRSEMKLNMRYLSTKESHEKAVKDALEYTGVVPIDKRETAYVGTYEKSTVRGSFKVVYKKSAYTDINGKTHSVAVAQMDDMDDSNFADLFWECIIGMIVQKMCAFMTYMRAPKVFAIRISRTNPDKIYLIQEWVNGADFAHTRSRDLRTGLLLLSKGLNRLQLKTGFMHRDFHSGNVMYDPQSEKVYLIDFGYACISMPKRKGGSIQNITNPDLIFYDVMQQEFAGKAYRTCTNKSHDMSILISSIIKFGAGQKMGKVLKDLHDECCWQYVNEVRTMKYAISKKIAIGSIGLIFPFVDGKEVRLNFFPETRMDRKTRVFDPAYMYELDGTTKKKFDVERFTMYCLAEIQIQSMRPTQIFDALIKDNAFGMAWDLVKSFRSNKKRNVFQLVGIYIYLGENQSVAIENEHNLLMVPNLFTSLKFGKEPRATFYDKEELAVIVSDIKPFTDRWLALLNVELISSDVSFGTHECVITLFYKKNGKQSYNTDLAKRANYPPRIAPKSAYDNSLFQNVVSAWTKERRERFLKF